MITRVHVNKNVIASNRKHGRTLPVITIKQGKKNTYAHEAHIHGPSRVVYRPDKPLSCGAWVWIETESEVTAVLNPNLDQPEAAYAETCPA